MNGGRCKKLRAAFRAENRESLSKTVWRRLKKDAAKHDAAPQFVVSGDRAEWRKRQIMWRKLQMRRYL
jgi:hypothetical protein